MAVIQGELAQMRALMMLQQKLTGRTHESIAAEFGCSKDTVKRQLRLAVTSDLIQKFEDELLKDLVPEAMRAVKVAMTNGNANVAVEILKGSGVLKRQVEKPSGGAESGDDLEIYIRSKRTKAESPRLPTKHSAPLPPVSPVLALPEVTADVAPQLLPVDGVDSVSGAARAVVHASYLEGFSREPLDSIEGFVVGEDE